MNDAKHTVEPWCTDYHSEGRDLYQVDSEYIGKVLSSDDARRIVACVNGCKGLSTKWLEDMVSFGETLLDRDNQREELQQRITDLERQLDNAAKAIEWADRSRHDTELRLAEAQGRNSALLNAAMGVCRFVRDNEFPMENTKKFSDLTDLLHSLDCVVRKALAAEVSKP